MCCTYDSYTRKTNLSRDWYIRACRVFPGGINHNIRYFQPYPFFTTRAAGRFLYDVDGNKIVDYWMGHWALILGHSPKQVELPLIQQMKEGLLFGTANTTSVLLAELLQKNVRPAELIRFCSTGSEATMYATRLARAFTKKKKIAKVIGGWHGFNTNLMHSVNYPFDVAEGKGFIDGNKNYIQSFPFNDLSGSLTLLKEVKDDLACIIIEPMLGTGAIPGKRDFLIGLREYARSNNVLFISDEIVTGFRLSFGSISDVFGLDPDLMTLGKIVGGGLPIGVVCGKEEIMRLSDPIVNKKKRDRCYIGGGTFSCNPMSMKAGLLTINYLANNKDKVYPTLSSLGEKVRIKLEHTFKDSGIDVELTGLGSLFQVHFLNNNVRSIHNATDFVN